MEHVSETSAWVVKRADDLSVADTCLHNVTPVLQHLWWIRRVTSFMFYAFQQMVAASSQSKPISLPMRCLKAAWIENKTCTALKAKTTLSEIELPFPQGKAVYYPITQVKNSVLSHDFAEKLKYTIFVYSNVVFVCCWAVIRQNYTCMLSQWTRIFFAWRVSWLHL